MTDNVEKTKNLTAFPLAWGARVMVWVAGAVLILMAFFITGDALLRHLIGISTGMAFEFGSYAFAIASTWTMGLTLFERGHIRIELLRNAMPARIRAAFDLVAWLSFLIVSGLLALRATDLAIESFESGARANSTVRTLLFIPQGLWAFGFIMAFLISIALGMRVMRDRSTEAISMRNEVAAELEHLE